MDVFREVTEMLGMKQNLTSGYYHQADGQAERTVGAAEHIVKNGKQQSQRLGFAITICFMGI